MNAEITIGKDGQVFVEVFDRTVFQDLRAPLIDHTLNPLTKTRSPFPFYGKRAGQAEGIDVVFQYRLSQGEGPIESAPQAQPGRNPFDDMK